jgi:lipopolysaccharide export LptBFGC system permease protein LptF
MKILILSAAVFLTVNFGAVASTIVPVVNEKAQQTFAATFKNVDEVSWSNAGNNYEAFFDKDGIKTRVTIDAKGRLLQTIRYYKENELPSNVLYKVKNDYKNSEIHGVTEISNTNGVHYRIILKDNTHYTHINANQTGDTELVIKYTRGDR